MLVISEVKHGNMHPRLCDDPDTAQANFETFCNALGYDPQAFLGLRIDPLWEDGSRILSLDESTPLASMIDSKPGSVDVKHRVAAHAIIAPNEIGLFALSADCFPVEIVGKSHHALCHIGWRSLKDRLLETTVEQVAQRTTLFGLRLGPGVRSDASLAKQLYEQVKQTGLMIIEDDDRDTVTDLTLFSRRRFYKNPAADSRGNHVALLLPNFTEAIM